MTITSVATATFMTDTTCLLRDHLLTNITDPISAQRASDEKFVMTSYPERPVKYPLITVKLEDAPGSERLGAQSTLHLQNLPLEIRIWARNYKEKDELAQQVINQLRNADLTTMVVGGLLNFEVLSAVNVDEGGQAGVRSRVIKVNYQFILGA